jgi:hypothetical protein
MDGPPVTLFITKDVLDIDLEQVRQTYLGVVINPNSLASLNDQPEDPGVAITDKAGNQGSKDGRIPPCKTGVSQVEPPWLLGLEDNRIESPDADRFGEMHLEIPCLGVIN